MYIISQLTTFCDSSFAIKAINTKRLFNIGKDEKGVMTSDAVSSNGEDYESSDLHSEMDDSEMRNWKRIFEPDSDSDGMP